MEVWNVNYGRERFERATIVVVAKDWESAQRQAAKIMRSNVDQLVWEPSDDPTEVSAPQEYSLTGGPVEEGAERAGL